MEVLAIFEIPLLDSGLDDIETFVELSTTFLRAIKLYDLGIKGRIKRMLHGFNPIADAALLKQSLRNTAA